MKDYQQHEIFISNIKMQSTRKINQQYERYM